MKSFSQIILFCLLFISYSKTTAQNSPVKWGKFTKAEIEMKKCAYDTSAGAITLLDYGEYNLDTDENYYIIYYHVRIKILDKRDLERANIVLSYYAKDEYEYINNIEAQTINFEADGRAIIQQVAPNQVFTEAQNEYYKTKRFAFPNVKVGSILEYKYEKRSHNYRYLDDWFFQGSIPSLYSELKVNMAPGFDYRFIYNGSRLRDKLDKIKDNRWVLENLPAVRFEPFVYKPWDFAEKIRFQLFSYQRRDGAKFKYTNTWEALIEELLTDNDYNKYLKKDEVAKKLLAQILQGNETQLEKLKKIYNYVNETFEWNGNFGYWVGDNLNKVLEKHKGGGVEINLLLTLLLREAGLEAYPVIISTKQNGLIYKDFPLKSQFNHLIVWTKIEEKEHLLDASQAYPYNILPIKDLNSWGYLVDKDKTKARWVEIKPKTNTLESYFVEADLSNLQKPQYKCNIKLDGYEGVENRSKYSKEKDEYFKKLFHTTGLKMNKLEVKNFENPELPLQVVANLESEESIEADQIYYQPILFNDYKENPFNFETRYLPIDLAHPFKKEYYLKITLPDGYKLEDSPKNLQLALPDKAGSFIYSVTTLDKIIQINCKINIQKTFFVQEEFPALKEFFNQVIAKLAEPIVLKKGI